MKVLHTVPSLSVEGGGVSSAIVNLMDELSTRIDATLLTVGNSKELPPKGWFHSVNGSYTPFEYSPAFKQALHNENPDLFHTHGLWLYANHATATKARKLNKPYIITPHGMLFEEALRRSKLKKQIFGRLMFWEDIEKAACLHVTSEGEMNEVRKFGYKGPVAIIGNAIDCQLPTISWDHGSKEKVIGYLGRIHPVKQIENILYAIAKANTPVKLKIAGCGSSDYIDFLKREIIRLGLGLEVEFVGFLQGEEKQRFLSSLSALFLPSSMESFGMVVVESLLAGVPVMTSTNTPWSILHDLNCGWWTADTPDAIAAVINEVSSRPSSELQQMGLRGRTYVRDHFDSRIIATQMLSLYEWVLNPKSTPKPDFIYV